MRKWNYPVDPYLFFIDFAMFFIDDAIWIPWSRYRSRDILSEMDFGSKSFFGSESFSPPPVAALSPGCRGASSENQVRVESTICTLRGQWLKACRLQARVKLAPPYRGCLPRPRRRRRRPRRSGAKLRSTRFQVESHILFH